MKKRVIATLIGLVIICGCSNNNIGDTQTQEAREVKDSVVTTDGGTKSFHDSSNESVYGVAVDTEYEEKIAELNQSEEKDDYEEEAKTRIQQKFTELGMTGNTSFTDKQYISEEQYLIYGYNTDSNITVAALVDKSINDIDISTEGAVQGSDYVVLRNIAPLGNNLSRVLELLYESGIYSGDIGIVESFDGHMCIVSIEGTEYSVNIDDGTVLDISEYSTGTEEYSEPQEAM
jgi:lipoprotein